LVQRDARQKYLKKIRLDYPDYPRLQNGALLGPLVPSASLQAWRKPLMGGPFLKGAAFTWCIGINDVTVPNAASVVIIANAKMNLCILFYRKKTLFKIILKS